MNERAQRRLDEAESGATLLRERVAAEVVKQQRAASDELRTAREQAAAHVAAARAEADEIRAKARALLDDARTEVTVLTRRRDEIAAELGGLSGVIQALAVSPDEPADATSDSLTPHPPEEDEHP